MKVLYEDNHILAVDKPANLSTQPCDSDPDNLLDRAKSYIKRKYNKPGNVFLEPIHRLDKPVSGIVLLARTSKALSRLQEQMREQTILKVYIGLLEGELASDSGILEHFLVHDAHKASLASASHTEAKRALLSYRLLQLQNNKSLVEITLHTGRYHQIRAQFSAAGCPVLGDRKYGSRLAWKEGAIALHHSKMACTHPTLGKELTFTSFCPFAAEIAESARR
ncbi:MAG TPA: RNA pseudouridine synthase [Rhabdochlamydiaceae bacterium]|jgi:23S rRNA pseudouridine1911/1915/1917 synthase